MSTSPVNISSTDKLHRKFRGLPADERVNQRRAQLLEAGLEAFGTRGFQGVGVREICAQAKLTERYFYESFKNREALFLAVYEAAAKRLEQLVFEAFAKVPASGADPARAALGAVLQNFREDPRVARIVLIEVLSFGAASDAAFAVSNNFALTIEKLSLALYPQLENDSHDSRLVANGLYGSTVYIAQRWTLEGFAEPLEVVIEHCALFYDAVAFKLGAAEGQKSAAPAETRGSTQHKARKRSAARVSANKQNGAQSAPARTRRKA